MAHLRNSRVKLVPKNIRRNVEEKIHFVILTQTTRRD